MKIQNIKVRGAIGFKKGLGVDEVEVDLSNLSGLIALAGPNGHGKTTLLESMSPFRTFASRPGALRNHFFLRDSFRDLSFEYGGDLYRTLVKVDGQTDRSEGFIWKNGYPEIDGKVTNYNKYLIKLLGSANLFYNSVFCAQNSAKLSDMTTGQLKQLFVEFLRLDRLSAYESTSKKCIGLLNGMSIQEERGISSLTEKINSYGDLDQQLAMLVEDEKQLIKDKAAESVALRDAEDSIEKLKEALSQNKVNIERLHDVEKDIATAITDKESKAQEADRQREIIKAEQLEIQQEATRLNVITDKEAQIRGAADEIKDLDADIKKISARMEETQAAGIKLADEVSKGEQRQNELTREIMDLDKDQGVYGLEVQVTEALDMIKDVEVDFRQMERDLAAAGQSFAMVQIESDIKACKDAMALLDKRDPECKSETCSFIVSALKAKEQLPGLEGKRQIILEDIGKDKKRINDAISANRATRAKLETKRDAILADLEAERLAVAEKKQVLEKERESIYLQTSEKLTLRDDLRRKWKADSFFIENEMKPAVERSNILAAQLPQVEIAWARIEDLKKKMDELNEKRHAIDVDLSRNAQAADARVAELREKKREIEDKIIPDAEKKIEDAEFNKNLHALNIEMTDDKISSNREKASITRQKIQEKEHAEKDLVARKAEYDRIRMEIHQWSYLRDACGKTGLQALEIDGVAPLVSGYANELLNQSFGPNFSVKLVTQNIDTGREVLDIVVIRGDGSETLLENLSGGEKVWILKALRLAMTLVSKEKSGRNFGSLFCDEEDGPLDSEKSQSFVGLYRSMMDVGKFKDCFYISHNPDVVAMADHLIQFSGSGIEVA